MSKLIVEMEMPKCCWDCACCDSEYRYCAASRKQLDDLNERPNWCPIVGVLPDEHGDLIDRDELKRCWTDDGFDLWVSHTEIDQQPIVIAAERKDDEQIH